MKKEEAGTSAEPREKAKASFVSVDKLLNADPEIKYVYGVSEFMCREELRNEVNALYENSTFFVSPKTATINEGELNAITEKLGQRISNSLSCEMVTLPPTVGSSKSKTDIRVGGLISQNEALRQICILVFPDELSALGGAVKYKTDGSKSDYGVLSFEQIEQYKRRNAAK